VKAGTAGWTAGQTLAALGAGVLLAVVFVAWERRTGAPMLPPSLFGIRPFAAANASALFMTAALSAAVFLIAQLCQLVLGYGPLVTGLRLLPWTATPLLVAPVAGRLSDRIGRAPVLAAGLLLQALGLAWFTLLVGGHTSYPSLVPALLVAGIGISMALPTAAASAMSSLPPFQLGKAAGVNSTVQRLGAVLGVAVVTAVFTAHGRLGSPSAFIDGFRPGLLVAAGLSLLGALTALGVGPRRRRATGPIPTAAAPELVGSVHV
jgi:Na+/melibiose symporter-like transporter